MEVLEMDESLRGERELFRLNDFTIESVNCPQLSPYTIFLRGDDKRKDAIPVTCEFWSEEKAEDYMETVTEVFNVWHLSLQQEDAA
jgi:hypothetical protein